MSVAKTPPDRPPPAGATPKGTPPGDAAARPAEPLRVALFSGNYNYVMDGPVRALNMLVAHLERRGHAVRVFAPTVKEPAFEHAGTLISVPSIALPGSRSEYRLGLGLTPRSRRILDDFQPTLIHLSAPDYTGKTALDYARRRRIPAVASFHTRFDTYPRYYGAPWLEGVLTGYMRRFYARCEHVYPPSASMAEELRRDGIGTDLRLWTRGVDADLFSPERRDPDWRRSLGFADDDVVTAFVGRLVLEKGVDIFAEAVQLAAAKNPAVKALVVGDGPERARFEQRLGKTGAFAGYLQGADLARAYASADMFFNPSVTETFGNVTLEAMACGLPSVCAAASGSVSLVEDGVTGFLSANEDGAPGYADALGRIAGDATLRRGMSERARARSLSFDWTTILDALIDNYRDAIAGYAHSTKNT
ncbi:MAG: glycosyltransferase family 1 protein [Pseudomonadota bacterium]